MGSMAWLYLLLASIFEVVFATTMKLSEGFTRLPWTIVTIVSSIGGLFFLGMALKGLPVSLAYPIWVGVGIVGTVLFGMLALGEGVGIVKILCIGLVLAGVVGLKVIAP